MATARQLLSDFTGGEVSPRVSTRADLARYEKSCASMRNFIPLQQGGAILRRGTERVGSALSSGVTPVPATLIIPWRAGSASEPDILLEIVGSTVRGWTNDGQILSGGVPYSITLPVPVTEQTQWAQRARQIVLTSASAAPVILTISSQASWSAVAIDYETWPRRIFADSASPARDNASYDLNFVSFGNGTAFSVQLNGVTTKRFNSPTTPGQARNPLAAVPFQVSYSLTIATQIQRIREAILKSSFVKNPTEVSVTHVASTTYRVEFTGSISGMRFAAFPVTENGTTRIEITTNSAGQNGEELAWSYPTVVVHSGTYYQCILPHLSTSTTPDLEPTKWTALTGAPSWESIQPSPTWAASTPYGLGNRGFPRACSFHDQRLILGGTPSLPQTFWGSAIGLPEVFTLGVEDDEALSRDIDAPDAPAIRWLASQQGLIIGTSAGVWSAAGEITLTPADVRLTPFSADRSSEVMPQVVGNEVLFLSQDRTQLLAFRRNEQVGPYETTDLTALSEHLGRYRLKRIVYCRQPQPVIYVLTDEPGLLLAITYNRQYDMIAFARVVIDGHIDAIGSAFDDDDGDVLWLCVRRGDRSSIERMAFPATTKPVDVPDTTATVHLDGWVVGSASGGYVGGLRHLVGKTVTILSSAGAVTGSGVVALGGVVTDTPLTIANNGFESGSLTGWTVESGSTASASTLQARTGTYSLRLQPGSLQFLQVLSANITITAGTTIKVRAYYKGSTTALSAVYPVVAYCYDGSANELLQVLGPPMQAETTVGDWTLAELTFVAPVGVSYMRIGSEALSTDAGTDVYVDDFAAWSGTDVDGRVAASGSNLTVGVPFTGYIETLEPANGNPAGPAIGNRKRWPDVTVKVYQSALPKVNGNRPSDYAQAGGAYRANPGTLRTGEYEASSIGWNSGRIVIEQDLPHRTEVIAVYGDMKVN